MPSYNRGRHIVWSLLSLINQEIPPDEIIFVDDGSEDGTGRIIENFQKQYPQINLKYYWNNSPGWTICVLAANCAIQKATGDILMLTEPEVLHPTQDVKIIKEHFAKPENDKTILIASPLYCVYEEALKKLTEEDFLDPIRITKKPNVHNYYMGFMSPVDGITFMPRGGTHHIAGILRKHIIAIGGYDEDFMGADSNYGHCASGYDDIDLLTRLRYYGIIEIRTDDILAIHLDHAPPPPYCYGPGLLIKNYDRMQAREKVMNEKLAKGELINEWQANIGKNWGTLKE